MINKYLVCTSGVMDGVQVSAPGVLDEVLVVCTVRALSEE